MSKLTLPRNRMANLDDNQSFALGLDSKNYMDLYQSMYVDYYTPISRDNIDRDFYELKSEWKKDTKYLSSITEICMHPAYQKIIGMGEKILPLILKDLSQKPTHWFWALHAITGANPVKTSDAGRMKEMAESWLMWANDKAIKW